MGPGKKGKKGAPRGRDKRTVAEHTDPLRLYEQAVQCVEAECDMVDDAFYALRGRRPRTLREDFCGGAKTACEWARRRKSNRAVGIDKDPSVLAWGREHNVHSLGESARGRVELIEGDVLRVETEPVDVVLAMNFSYQLFKERATLLAYFRRVRDALSVDGVFFLDAYGGTDSYRPVREKTKSSGFTYVWDQASFNPISGEMT